MRDYERESASRFQNLEDNYKLKNTLHDAKAGIKIMARTMGSKKVVVLFLVVLAGSFFPALLAYFNKRIIDAATKFDMHQTSEGFHLALVFVLAVTVVSLSVALLQYLKDYFVTVWFPKLTDDLLQNVMKKSMHVRLHLLDDAEYRNKVSWAADEMPLRLQNGVMNIALLIQDACTILSLALTVAVIGIWIAVPLWLGCVPVIYATYKQNRAMYHYQLESFLDKKKQYYLHTISYRRAHLRDLRYYGLADYNKNKWESLTEHINEERKKINIKYAGIKVVSNAWMFLMTGLAIALVVMRSARGGGVIGNMALIFTALQSMQAAILSCFTRIITIQESSRYIDGYTTLMNFEDETGGDQVLGENFDIEFRDVTFTYPEADHPVIEHLNIKIRAGEKIAIVGDNGSGKSTFIALLSGFYPLDSGEIRVGGIPLQECLADFRKKSSFLYQMSDTFLMSIEENIKAGDYEREVSDSEVINVAKLTGAHAFIEKFKEGYQTVIGYLHVIHMFDLSGGEKQKVLLSRLLLRRSARLLVMDEPTAALDPLAEADLYKNFADLAGNRMVLMISHRMGATKLADRILVFQEGKIVEQGTHEQLIKKNGKYTAMYRAQAKWYKV